MRNCIDYYRNKNVRDRIVEFLGGDHLNIPTCRYVVGGADVFQLEKLNPVASLGTLLEQGGEINRSLWDGTSLLADLDVEYVNFDYPFEIFARPERAFDLLNPTVKEIEDTLSVYGITALKLLSGRGYHFIWRIQRESAEFNRLARIGEKAKISWDKEKQFYSSEGRASKDLANAFTGLGLLMEFLAYNIKQGAALKSDIPVELTALEVGPSMQGREMISIDLSEYGDPLYMRTTRAAFSVYLKPWHQQSTIPQGILEHLPLMFVVPMKRESSWRERIEALRSAQVAAELAEGSSAKIPDVTVKMTVLIEEYESSNIAEFHRWFFSQEQHEPGEWKDTYDRLSLDILPACVRRVLEQPNDLLLQPAHIRQLVRVMLALGWHPRHIAGLIHSKYARPFGWTQFCGYDPAVRADFYTRIFAGIFVTGYDDLVDFNCVSAQEQKICFSNCKYNLLDFQKSALNRRKYGKLAHRPFNRLLL